MLTLADNLKLPLDAATQTFAFIGRKGSGKTFGAGKLAELLIDHGVQVVILDSVGNWYGLRLAADGRHAGIDIAIVGGLRGDVPLEATGGALIADVIVDSGRSLIIDVSQFSKADRQRFATALGERLWQRKKGEHEPTPVHLIIEESQLIVPENANRQADAARMVGIYEEIIRLGRNYGIGVTMITQRPQSVSKEVLNQTECLMVFQVNGAHERKALKEWIVHQGMDTALLAELPTLKPGNCYVWSPQWLEVLRRIRIAPKRTFDSTGTPTAGAHRSTRRELKAIDLDDLKAKMAATIERARADDPKELRRQIADLQRQLAARPAPAAEVRIVEKPVLTKEQAEQIEALAGEVEDLQERTVRLRERLDTAAAELAAGSGRVVEQLAGLRGAITAAMAPISGRHPAPAPPQRASSLAPAPRASAGAVPLEPRQRQGAPVGERRANAGAAAPGSVPSGKFHAMMVAMAQAGKPLTDRQVVARAGMALSGTFDKYLGQQRTAGWVDGPRAALVITDAGLDALGEFEPPPTGAALRDYWLNYVGGGKKREMLRVIFDAWPQALPDAEVARRADMALSGTFDKYLGQLRTLQLVEGPRNALRCSDEMYP